MDVQPGSRIALDQATNVLTSEQQDALPTTCAECDCACDKIPGRDECCICRDTSSYSGMMMNGGMAYCDTCRDRSDRRAEAAHEKFMEDFYGAGSPVTLDEQHAAAWEQKQGLRRR